MLIDVNLANDVARSETSAVAYHRFHDADGRENHMVAGLRYVDRFERRGGEWRIARRVCAFEWRRTDPVGDGSSFADTYTRGCSEPRRHRLAHPRLTRTPPPQRTLRSPRQRVVGKAGGWPIGNRFEAPRSKGQLVG